MKPRQNQDNQQKTKAGSRQQATTTRHRRKRKKCCSVFRFPPSVQETTTSQKSPDIFGKDEVASSNLAISSKKDRNRLVSVFLYAIADLNNQM